MEILQQGCVFSSEAGSNRQSLTFPMPCVTSTGRWLCAFRAAPQKVSNTEQHVLLCISDDQGKHWQAPTTPFIPQELEGKAGLFRIATVTDMGEGHLVAALNWVDFSDPELPYFNETTEGLLDTRVYLSHSFNDGTTWGTPELIDTTPFNVPTPLTGPILNLPDGAIACQLELNKAYSDPQPWKHASVMLFSDDEGATWPRHSVITQDPENRIFYWDQRPSVLPDGTLFDVFWTFDRASTVYRNIHACRSEDNGMRWSPLWDTGVPGQPGPVVTLGDGSLAMPVVDRTAAPKITVRCSRDGGRTWPEEEMLVVYDAAGASQTETKRSMQDAWAEMYAFSVGLPNMTPLPGGGALLVYYAGQETDHTAIHWAVIR